MSRIIFGSFLSAVLLAAPFLAPILFPAAWVAFVPLFWAIGHAKNLRAAVCYGWLTGFVAHLVGFHWLVYTINVFGGFPYPISAVVFLIYAALQGLQIAIFAFLVVPPGERVAEHGDRPTADGNARRVDWDPAVSDEHGLKPRPQQADHDLQ